MVDTARAAGTETDTGGLPLGADYAGPRDLEVETVLSSDGTPIAYEKSGSGPAVVILGGGLNDKAMFTPLATHLSEHFTVYNYDRRGRGDSGYGDPDRYTIQQEVDDLAAVLGAVDGPSHVFANCTGGQIAILAAASGVPMLKLGLYEPPYWSPAVTAGQLAALKQYIKEDRRSEAVTLFGRDIVGFLSDETLDYFKEHPAWSAFESMAPSTYYDAIISKDHSEIPYEELPKITVPTLVMRGDEGEQEIHDSCATIAERIPQATLVTKEGYNHLFDQDAWAPELIEYFRA